MSIIANNSPRKYVAAAPVVAGVPVVGAQTTQFAHRVPATYVSTQQKTAPTAVVPAPSSTSLPVMSAGTVKTSGPAATYVMSAPANTTLPHAARTYVSPTTAQPYVSQTHSNYVTKSSVSSVEEEMPTEELLFNIYSFYANMETGIDLKGAEVPSDEIKNHYTAALIAGARRDGALGEKEEAWIVGHQACFGAGARTLSKANMNRLKALSLDEVVANLKADEKLLACRRTLIYHCLCAAAAGGELTPEELAAIQRFADALDMEPDEAQKLLDFRNREAALEAEKFAYLWDSHPIGKPFS
jgi:hypothetical protein